MTDTTLRDALAELLAVVDLTPISQGCSTYLEGRWQRARDAARAALAQSPAPSLPPGWQTVPAKVYVECCECTECGHIGINDAHETDAACNHCQWSGPSPKEDHCPECHRDGTMTRACPECSGRYALLAESHLSAAPALAAPEPAGWLLPGPVTADHPLECLIVLPALRQSDGDWWIEGSKFLSDDAPLGWMADTPETRAAVAPAAAGKEAT